MEATERRAPGQGTATARRLTGGQAVVEALRAGGVDTVFGIPGVHNLTIYDALRDAPDVRHVVCRHEQGAGFCADGYARTAGRPGVFVTTTGPGATNAFTALGEAWSDSSPVLHLASQLATPLIDRERGVNHELVDQVGTFRQITRHHESIRDLARIAPAVAECLTAIQSGRPRAAYLDFPEDVLNASDEVTITAPQPPARPAADPDAVRRAAERLAGARRPAIIAGVGVHRSGASDELLRLAEALQAPVFETAPGRGAIPSDHPLAVGGRWTDEPRLWQVLAESDALLAVGTRLGGGSTSNWKVALPPLLQLDADPAMIGKNYPVEVALAGDARATLALLNEEVARHGARADEGPARAVRVLCAELDAEMRAAHPVPMGVLDALRGALARDAIVTNDSLIQYWTARHLPVYTPRSYHIPWIYGTLGSALPFAIGAAVAAPGRQVVAIGGDGAFMFTCAELATAVQAGANVVCVVCNDRGYNAMRRHQRLRYGDDRVIASDLATPDFAAFARSFGALGLTLDSPTDLGPALREALAAGRPAVLDLPLALDVPWK
ncbi:MAG TPA: thiamine pyrophosphate-binding protein [Thermomicrobiales bacterium]|nr:thiamine pyrophosphate-binding protein [Thermomicrobiales bacterium]